MSDRAAVVNREDRCCLVLASGGGARMGGPKALLLLNDRPLASAHAAARHADCGRTIVVTRAHIAEVLRRADRSLELVISEEPDELGPAGSIAAAVRSGALAGHEVVIVTPVDVMPVSREVIEALAEGALRGEAARPIWDGRAGHPVACRRALLEQHYCLGAPPLRDVLSGLGGRCIAVPVGDPAVGRDLDTPEAWEAATGTGPAFWR